MMNKVNSCASAWVVSDDGAHWLPEDEREYNWGLSTPFMGCNRLRCSGCGQFVKSKARVSLLENTPALCAEIYAREEWWSHPNIVSSPLSDCRLYLCRCSGLVVQSGDAVDPPANDLLREYAWSCAGHPGLTLPTEFDGVALASPIDVASLAKARLSHVGSPTLARTDPTPRAVFLARLYHLLPEQSGRDALSLAVAEELTSPGVEQRAAALRFFDLLPKAKGAKALLAVATANADLFAGVTDPKHPHRTLEEMLYMALTLRLGVSEMDRHNQSTDKATLEVLRSALLAGRQSKQIVTQLGRKDLRWLGEHAGQIAQKSPEVLASLVLAFSKLDDESLVGALRQIQRAGTVSEASLLAEVKKRMVEPRLSKVLSLLVPTPHA